MDKVEAKVGFSIKKGLKVSVMSFTVDSQLLAACNQIPVIRSVPHYPKGAMGDRFVSYPILLYLV